MISAQPEVIVIMPCGYSLASAQAEFRSLALPAAWNDLPAVRNGRVFVVDASSYFSRPGPRLAAGLAILANAIHSREQTSATSAEAGLVVRVAAGGRGA